MPTPPTPPPLQALTRRQVIVVWLAFATAVVVAVAVSSLAPAAATPPAPGFARVMLLVVALLAAGEAVAGAILLRSMRRNAGTAAAHPGVLTIVACSLALGVALLAAAVRYATEEPAFLAFAAAAFAVLLWWYPSAARWSRLAAPDGARANAMWRE